MVRKYKGKKGVYQVDIERVLKQPAKDRDWALKTVIGGILLFIPIVSFVAYGYLVETAKKGIEAKDELPAWENWLDLFVRGFVVSVISLVYLLIPLAVMVLGWGIGAVSALGGGYQTWHVVGFGAGWLVGLILALLFGFFIPMVWVHYAACDRFGAAFEFGDIWGKIRAVIKEYFITYLVYAVLLILVAMGLSLVPVIGIVAASVVNFYISLAFMHEFGRIYGQTG